MGREIDLLRSIPRPKRNLSERSQLRSPEVIRESKRYGRMYFDGPREYGYGDTSMTAAGNLSPVRLSSTSDSRPGTAYWMSAPQKVFL
jgi:hypothetical protein